MSFRLSVLLCAGVFIASCSSKKDESSAIAPVFKLLHGSETGIDFVNLLKEDDTVNQLAYNYAYNGGGVAAGDLNNDGLEDLVFTGNNSPSKVYVNKGEMRFEQAGEKCGIEPTGWCTGVSIVDINNDGWNDVYICRSGPSPDPEKRKNLLYLNQGNGTFKEQAADWGLDDAGYSTQAAFFDMDNDGDLDCYMANHALPFFKSLDVTFSRSMMKDDYNSQRMYENKGNRFENISVAAGMDAMGYGLSATPGDFNRDGLTDLYVCNDYFIPDYFYINLGNGRFKECLKDYFKHSSLFSMGSDAADYNNDGWLDLFTCDMLSADPRRYSLLQGPPGLDKFMVAQQHGYGPQFMRNALQTNISGKKFSDLSYLTGTARSDWSWSPLFADFNNDGWKDLYVTNGFLRDINNLDFIIYMGRLQQKENRLPNFREIAEQLPYERLSNFMFRNTGKGNFDLMTEPWGTAQASFSAGSAWCDLNNDGRLELVVNNIQDTAFIYQNIGTTGNWLKVKLKGKNGQNSQGLGAKILALTDSGKIFSEVHISKGYQGSVSPVAHLGLGGAQKIRELTIIWAGGAYQTLRDVEVNKQLELSSEQAAGRYQWNDAPAACTFEEVPGPSFIHSEEDVQDFRREFLLPHRHSQLGPGMAVGDVNGDGLEDVFIGNGRNRGGAKLFLQKAGGNFSPSASAPWAGIPSDITGSLLFDADMDGDNDLYVVTGGSEYAWPSEAYSHQFYLNDGRGNFISANDRIPACKSSGSCISAADYDLDGDLDLFVGGRLTPGYYPTAESRSYILRNEGGRFSDATAQLFPGLQKPGLVCAALWTDFNNDRRPDLLLTGEWMAPAFLENNGSTFTDKTEAFGMMNYVGWYNSLLPIDADADGDMDYIAGNKGMNSHYRASAENPLGIYWNDFDNNGGMDLVLTYSVNGREYPINSYDELALQTPSLIRKKFIRYGDFAGKSIQELLDADKLKNNYHATNFQSVLLRNNGSGFSVEALPIEAQAGPIYGLAPCDANMDGFTDILCIGNNYTTRVEFGYDDALNGLVLLNDGSGHFNAVSGIDCGFYVPGDGKSLAAIRVNGEIRWLAAQNNGMLKCFRLKQKQSAYAAAPGENSADVQLANGKTLKIECYYGSGYLSSGSRFVAGGPNVKAVNFNTPKGEKRQIKP